MQKNETFIPPKLSEGKLCNSITVYAKNACLPVRLLRLSPPTILKMEGWNLAGPVGLGLGQVR